MVKMGMIIGDRYEIIEKIGTGGMSDVYKARDQKLSRNVAVKVLKQEFCENENFVSKFRTEAQAAAGLMHPNIVNVYDVGEEDDIHYIVMELVEGITLKKYIEKKARLTYKEAVSIAIGVCLGMEAAHNNHIIHRDIKPQNIIISKDGKVKVTDFGIAKAASSNTITSNVMGSVHYTSPEQARGGYSDEKSDIYSLGITMFEMLTGRVPFNGETTVAIAIKHIQEEMPSPREYVPEIPTAVEAIVMKCCEKAPDRRYANAHELIEDLKKALLTPDEDFVVRNDPDLEAETRSMTDDEMVQIRNRSGNYYSQTPSDFEEEEPLRLAQDEEDYREEDYGDEDYDYDPKMERITTILAILAGVVIVIIILILAFKLLGGKDRSGDAKDPTEGTSPILSEETDTVTDEVTYVTMPDVVGAKEEDAREALLRLGLVPKPEYETSDTVEAGLVIRAGVEKDAQVAVNSTVVITVSSGPQGVEMPSVVGMTYEEAEAKLKLLGFVVNKTTAFSAEVEEGKIISQTPEAAEVAPAGCTVTVTVSLGPEVVKIPVPKLIGREEDEAIALLVESGLTIGNIDYVNSDTVEAGVVISQSLAEGSYADPGTAVNLQVSRGPELITYKFDQDITAPTAEEAPQYKHGTEVTVSLVGDDGVAIFTRKITDFPERATYYGLTCGGGILTFTYSYTTEGSTTVNENGETVVVPGETITVSFSRVVTFDPE
ncbi:MAG: Stk1 family PASTA domain-containing Ser/Thr kinase [Lachnospiraceae bacterium]|nr:Stk1 family PASTA domain-containing Ser/Thr kinase [Lachnospiraceae bacterium]